MAPFPEPTGFFADAARQPMKTVQSSGYGWYEVAKSDGNQRCYPGIIVFVPSEHGPALVWILRTQHKTVSTFSDVCGWGAERKKRVACRFQRRLSKGHKPGPTSARKL